MSYRVLLVAGVLAASLSGYCVAETIATETGIAVKESSVPTPSRGMTMQQVVGKFGNPATKIPAVGKPPISRWEYPGFIVFFEYDHVIHSVVTESPAAPATPAPVAG
ncbi:MAG: hypothetical protein ACHQIL_05490 [Steroidobacterales bacterium]